MWDDSFMSNAVRCLGVAFLLFVALGLPAGAVDSFDAGSRPEFQQPTWQHASFVQANFDHSAVRFGEKTLVPAALPSANDSMFQSAPQDLKDLNMQNGLGTNDPTSTNQVSPFTSDEQARFQNMRMEFNDPSLRRFNFN